MKTKKVWFVTGASKGLGLALVKALLSNGHAVAATSRTREALENAVGQHPNFLPLEMDLTRDDLVAKAVHTAVTEFGRIDVVVNNAGYSQIGTLEELSDAEAKANFEVNVFGTLNVIRNIAPQLRKQKAGHILNIASIGGLAGNFPGFGIYCATKFAVAGLTEALAEELQRFNVQTTLVYPGYFRTDFLSADSVRTPLHPIDAYVSAREMEAAHLSEIHGHQPNDPERAAAVFMELSEMERPPLHFFMGEDAYAMAQKKIALLTAEAETWKQYSLSTGYASAEDLPGDPIPEKSEATRQ